MSNTSPAPWMVLTGKHILVIDANGNGVADFGLSGTRDDEQKIANAALSASSPTMLEALIDLQDKIARQLEASELPDVQLIEWQEIISNAMEKIHAEAS